MKVIYKNINYVSIGLYEDNQDGIFYYAREIDTRADLITFLIKSELGISALFFGLISQYIIDDNLIIFTNNVRKLILENEAKLLDFKEKYFDEYVFNYKFLDLVYGPLGMPLKHEDDKRSNFYIFDDGTELEILDEISNEYLDQNIFINTDYYFEFYNDINNLIGYFKGEL